MNRLVAMGDEAAPFISVFFDEMPTVDLSSPTSVLAAEALEYVRSEGIRPWLPVKELAHQYPALKQFESAAATSSTFGRFRSDLLVVVAPTVWRAVHGSFLLDSMPWASDMCADWMASNTATAEVTR